MPFLHRSHPVMGRIMRLVRILPALTVLVCCPSALPGVDRASYVFPPPFDAGPVVRPSEGAQRMLVIYTETSDSPAPPGAWPPSTTTARSVASAINAYFARNSYNRLQFEMTIVPEVIRLSQPLSSYSGYFATESSEALTLAGSIDPRYDQGRFQKIWLARNLNWCGTGCAFVGGSLFGVGFGSSSYVCHEINHNNGLSHIGAVVPSGQTVFTGNRSAHNGAEDIGATLRGGARYSLGWLKEGDADGFGVEVLSGTVAATGYRSLVDMTRGEPTPGQHRGALILSPTVPGGNAVFHTLLTHMDSTNIDRGLYSHDVYRKTGLPNSMNYIHHLDAGNVPPAASTLPLRLGRSVSYPNGMVVSPLIRNPGTADRPSELGICILPRRAGNRPPAISMATVSATSTPIGTTITLQAEASDPDGDQLSFHWRENSVPIAVDDAVLRRMSITRMTSGTSTYTVEVHDRRGGSTTLLAGTHVATHIPTTGTGLHIGGVVVDATTGMPITGAVVTMLGRSSTTASDGAFFIPDIPQGKYSGTNRPLVTATGYATMHYARSGSEFEVAAKFQMTALRIAMTASVADPIVISMGSAAVDLTEGAGPSITIARSGSPSHPVRVRYLVADDSALSGTDYTSTASEIVIPPDVTGTTLPIAAIADAVPDPGRTFRIMLISADAGYPTRIASPFTTTVTILDGGLPPGNQPPVVDAAASEPSTQVLP